MNETTYEETSAAFDEVQERFLKGLARMKPTPAPGAPTDERRLEKALVEYADLLKLDLPDPKGHLAWLREGSLVMVFGPRGVGKTMLQLGLVASLTTGRDFLSWPIAAPVGGSLCGW